MSRSSSSTSSEHSDSTRAPGYKQLLAANPQFRMLWLADLISHFGDWFNTVAVYAIVLRLSDSGQALAAVMIVRTLPAFLVSPLVGPLVDRFDRRRLMIIANLARVLGIAGLLWARQTGSLWGLLASLVWMITWLGVHLPARNAVVPMLTTRTELPVANALSGGTWSIMLAIGAAIGGWATAAFGEVAALVIDGGTFVVSALCLMRLPAMLPPLARSAMDVEATADAAEESADETSEAGTETRQEQSAGFIAGLRYLARTPKVAALLGIKPMMALAAGGILVIPIYGDGIFPMARGPAMIGLLYATRGVGAIIGSMVVRKLVGDLPRTLRRMILVGFLFSASGYVVMGFAPSIAMAALGLGIAAIGAGINWVFSGTLIQIYGEPAYHGRLFSLEFGMMTLVFSVMSWLGGVGLDHWDMSARDVATGSGLIMVLPILIGAGVMAAFRRERLRRQAIETEAAKLTASDTFELPVIKSSSQ